MHASWTVDWQELMNTGMEVMTPKKLLSHARIRLDDLLKFPSIFPKSERHFLLKRKKRNKTHNLLFVFPVYSSIHFHSRVLYVNFIAILLEDEPQSSAQKPLKHCRRLPRKTQMTQKTIDQN